MKGIRNSTFVLIIICATFIATAEPNHTAQRSEIRHDDLQPIFAAAAAAAEQRYVTKGFRDEFAAVAARLALPADQRVKALLLPSPRSQSTNCSFPDPFLLVYPAASGEVDSPKYETIALTPFYEWLAWTDRRRTRTYETGDPDLPFVLVRWKGSLYCIAVP